jgi:hypothetical protein
MLQQLAHQTRRCAHGALNARENYDPVHPAYNPYFSACFFSRNNIFLSQQISQQCFSAGLSAQPNGAYDGHRPYHR